MKGASEGAGLGNKFLMNIRMTDAIVHVVRCFVDDDIIHVDGNVDPLRDVEVISLELILADLSQIEKRLERVRKWNVKYLNKYFVCLWCEIFLHKNWFDLESNSFIEFYLIYYLKCLHNCFCSFYVSHWRLFFFQLSSNYYLIYTQLSLFD